MVGSKNSEWLNTASLDWESTSSNPLFLIYWMALWEKIVLEKLLRYVGKNSNNVRIFHTTGSLKLFGSVVSSYVDTWYLKMEGFWFSFWLWFLIQTFKRIMPLLVIILGLLRSSLFQRDVTLYLRLKILRSWSGFFFEFSFSQKYLENHSWEREM